MKGQASGVQKLCASGPLLEDSSKQPSLDRALEKHVGSQDVLSNMFSMLDSRDVGKKYLDIVFSFILKKKMGWIKHDLPRPQAKSLRGLAAPQSRPPTRPISRYGSLGHVYGLNNTANHIKKY